jgi:hypothetical protein
MRNVPRAVASAASDLERDLLREITERLDRIERLLLARFGPRDDADAGLVRVLAEVLGPRPFTSAHVLQLAVADEAVRDAINGCDVTSSRQLGWLLKRLSGVTRHGLRLECVDQSRDGLVWRVQVVQD